MRNILSLTQVLDATYDLYRKHMKSLIGYTTLTMLVSSSIMYGVMVVLVIIFAIIIALVGVVTSFDGENMGAIVVIGIGFFILMLPTFSIMQLVAAGPNHAVEESRKGNIVTFGKMFNYSFKKIWYVMTSTIAYSIVAFGIIGLGGLMYYLLYLSVLIETSILIQWAVAIVIVLVVLVGCIWFGIYAIFYLQVALCEKKHFFGAIIGSFRLVRGQFIKMLGIIASYSISYFIIYLSIGGLSSVLSSLIPVLISDMGGTGLIIGILFLQLLLSFLQIAVSIVITPIQYITIPIIYFNERNRRYGDDLYQQLNTLIGQQEVVVQ